MRLTGSDYSTERGIATAARLTFLEAVFKVEPRAWRHLGKRPLKAWRAFCGTWRTFCEGAEEYHPPDISQLNDVERKHGLPRTTFGAVDFTIQTPVSAPIEMPGLSRNCPPEVRRALEQERHTLPVPTLSELQEALSFGSGRQQVHACEFVRALWEWAESWHIAEPWSVWLAAEQFTRQPPGRWPKAGSSLFDLAGDPDATAPDFRFRAWQRTCETRRHYEDELEAEVATYLDKIDAQPLPAGVRPTPDKRQLDHFEWLARYQVKGESFGQIASAVGRDRMAVTDAVKQTAYLIGLTLRRAGKPGRPRKP